MTLSRYAVAAVWLLSGCAQIDSSGNPIDPSELPTIAGRAPTPSPAAADPGPDPGDPGEPADPPPPPPPPAPPPPAPAKEVLTVTWQGQQTGYWCGPGSTRMALTTRMANPPTQQALASYMGTTVNGTDHVGLVRNALNHYLGTTWFETKVMNDPPTAQQRTVLKQDVLFNIGKGYPLVVNVVSGWRPPGYPGGTIYHYVAVVGYDANGDKVLIADPAGAGAAGGSWNNVPKTYWISIWDLGTWIGGKGYTA